MEYWEMLKIAESKLGRDHSDVLDELAKVVAVGSTGGEVTGMVGYYLKHLNEKNLHAYTLLKDDIEAFIKDCKKCGIEIL